MSTPPIASSPLNALRNIPNPSLATIKDDSTREVLRALLKYLSADTSMVGFQFRSFTFTQVGTFVIPHALGFTPKDVIQTSLVGGGDLLWNYSKFDSSNISVTVTGKAVQAGTLLDFTGGTLPTDCLLADGSAVSRTAYPDLFAAIGTKFGAGDGSTTFNLPDSRGRATIGVGQGSGLTSRSLADKGGEEAHTLTGAESGVAPHTHTYSSTNNKPSLYHDDDGAVEYSGGFASGGAFSGSPWTQSGSNALNNATATNASSAHNNMPPYLAANKIIYTRGVGTSVTPSNPLTVRCYLGTHFEGSTS